MWFFRKKNKQDTDLGWLECDMHSHLLPGIDDGAPDVSSGLELLKGLGELGFSRVITTPHIYWEFYPNTPDSIGSAAAELRQASIAAGLNMQVSAAAEYFLDEHFETSLEQKVPLLCVNENRVLVEFSMITAKLDLQDILFKIQIAGYQPIIAHPERYVYLQSRKNVFDELKSMGCFFQLNLLSLSGYYGRTVQELAAYLIKKKFYDYAGTDLHHVRQLNALQKLGSVDLLLELQGSGQLKNAAL